MQKGIKLYIEREIGVGTYILSAYKNGISAGLLIGYKNHRAGTVKCYPYKNILKGAFADGDLPIECRFDEIEWASRRKQNG